MQIMPAGCRALFRIIGSVIELLMDDNEAGGLFGFHYKKVFFWLLLLLLVFLDTAKIETVVVATKEVAARKCSSPKGLSLMSQETGC